MINIKKIFIFMLAWICTSTFILSNSYATSPIDSSFKVVGYYSEIFEDPIDQQVQFDKLTHIIYAFLIPKGDGSLIEIQKPDKLKELVEKAHRNNVNVFIAIGGWSYQNIPLAPTFEKMAASEESRKKFIGNVIQFVETYHLDGVDLDWEYPNVGQSSQNYEKLVLELSKELKKKGKHFTAALCGAWSKTEESNTARAITDLCLKAFDWIHIMAYDLHDGQHSPFWFTETSIDYWLHRNVPKEKIVIGVPFYARPSWKQYRHLVAENRENAYKDYVEGEPLDSYYNGIHTIKEKTRLALRKASGIMIFDINEDTTDELSLLKAIDDTIQEAVSMPYDEWSKKIYLIVDGKELTFEPHENMGKPFIDKNNRTLIPVRKPLEAIGAEISFDQNKNIVTVRKDDILMQIPINKDYIQINDQRIKMDTQAIIKEGRTYIPLRYIFEGFDYQIQWHENSKTVIVNQQ